jgi:hypothetical protein
MMIIFNKEPRAVLTIISSSPRLHLRFVLLVWLERPNHVAHALRVEMREWDRGQDHIAPVVSRPVQVAVAVAVVGVQAIAAVAVTLVLLLLQCLRLLLLLDVVVQLVLFGGASEEELVLLDGRMRVDGPRDVVSGRQR